MRSSIFSPSSMETLRSLPARHPRVVAPIAAALALVALYTSQRSDIIFGCDGD
ncbi:MAG: hypothetical protein ACD_28C00267G0002 [uncultured bacterium]|nr:MAG: hypothetical protein ACD_28C00267G0002 [uncultured bacterium]